MTLGVGAFSGWILVRGRKRKRNNPAIVRLCYRGAEGPLRIHALVDSGNTLTEPISGAPVSVLDARIFYRLWPEGLSGFRVIPYHSVGKKSGILKGISGAADDAHTAGCGTRIQKCIPGGE